MALAQIVAIKIEIAPSLENKFSNRIKNTKSKTVATLDVNRYFQNFRYIPSKSTTVENDLFHSYYLYLNK